MLRWLALFGILAVAAQTVHAVSVQKWSASSPEEVSAGTFEGTALDEEGRLRLAPTLETLWGPAVGIVWDVDTSDTDAAFLGLSSPGRLARVTWAGEAVEWFRTGEDKLVAAVASDGEGGAYFGLSPDGTVFRTRGPGLAEEVTVTGAKFIWALARGADGSLWIGTGLPGWLIRCFPDGECFQAFDAEDDPVRCIVGLDDGAVLIGTGGRGRVLRIGSDGRPFVLLDAEEAEIVSLEVGGDGEVYALAAKGTKQVGAPASPQPSAGVDAVRVTAAAPPRDPSEGPGDATPRTGGKQRPARRRFSTPRGAALYRLDRDGGARRLWESANEVPFTLVRGEAGTVLVATGDEGRIYQIDDRGRSSVWATVPSDQASAMVKSPDGRVLVGGTTDARLELLGPGLRRAGSYLTLPVDAQTVADWGRLTWDADTPRGTKLRIYARAGNTSEPDGTWSDWVSLKPEAGREAETRLPATRWFQARLDLEPSREGASPVVRRLELFYLPKNRRPDLQSTTVQPAGVVWTRSQAQSSSSRGPVVADDPVARKAAQSLALTKSAKPIRKSYELGARTVTWEASDPDGDALSYALEIRREGTDDWILLATNLEDRLFGWDTRGLPDGMYRVRVTATDSRDNPDGKELDDEELSAVFAIDNTRPRLGSPRFERRGHAVQVEFTASDPGGNVAAVEVALDAGAWQPLDPLDGVADSSEERYRVTLEAPQQAPDPMRTLRVRVTDSAGNLGGDAWALERP